MGELTSYLPGKVMAFAKRKGTEDAAIEECVLVEVVDISDGEIEFAFDAPNPLRRYYLRLPAEAVRALLPPTTNPAGEPQP